MGFNSVFKGLMHALFRSYNGGHTDVLHPMVLFLQEPKSEIPFFLHYRQGLDSHILRFKAELVSKSPADKDRQFVISYYLCDDTISVYENPLHNTGNTEQYMCYFSFKQVSSSHFVLPI